ncbi:MAG: hypothetical protein ACE5HD_11105 [Acidobacteriota bacterium]
MTRRYKDPLLAGLLSLVPGAGHVYAGCPARGATFFMGVLIGLFLFVVPGLLLWLVSIPDVVICVRSSNRHAVPLDLAMVTVTDGPALLPAPSSCLEETRAAPPTDPSPGSGW